jgi:hypothetical protein
MTEEEWLAYDDAPRLLRSIQDYASVRKLRLIAAAWVRRAETGHPKDEVKLCDDLIESVADYPRPWDEVMSELECRPGESWQFTHILASDDLEYVTMTLRQLVAFYSAGEHHYATELIHEVVGNPFRPATIDHSWRTSTVLALAQGMYHSRDFSRCRYWRTRCKTRDARMTTS